MRTKNTIKKNGFVSYTIAFTDKGLFDLFLDYLKESTVTEMRNMDRTYVGI